MPGKTLSAAAFWTVLTIMAFAFTPYQSGDNKLTEKEKQEGWQLLFDGNTMNGWRMFRNRTADGWEVKNGELVNRTEGATRRSDIITQEQFENFELSFDWKLNPGKNSGVMYHVTEDNGATYESGPEYSLIDDEGYAEELAPAQKSGANYDVHAPSELAAKPVGQYNTSKIVVKGNHIEHWLNGKKVVEFEKGSPEWLELKNKSKWKDVKTYSASNSGHIALQDHGGGVAFKNIKIRKL